MIFLASIEICKIMNGADFFIVGDSMSHEYYMSMLSTIIKDIPDHCEGAYKQDTVNNHRVRMIFFIINNYCYR